MFYIKSITKVNQQLHHHQIPVNQFRRRQQDATGHVFIIRKVSYLSAISYNEALRHIKSVLNRLIQKMPGLNFTPKWRLSSFLNNVWCKIIHWLLVPIFQALIFVYRKIVNFISSASDAFFSFMDEFFMMDEPLLQRIPVEKDSGYVFEMKASRRRANIQIPAQKHYAFFTIKPSRNVQSIMRSGDCLNNDHKDHGFRFFDPKTKNPDTIEFPWRSFQMARCLFVLPLFKNPLKLPFKTPLQHVRSILNHCPENLFAALDPVFADALHRDNAGS